jgi:carbon storage regulator CsrA
MLVLTRRIGEQIVLPGFDITLSVRQIHGGRVVVGIEAPREIPIRRGELQTLDRTQALDRTEKLADQGSEPSQELQDVSVLLAAQPSLHRNEYQAALVRRGLNAFTADDGLHCLNSLRKGLPNVLVIELELPWGGGDGVLEVVHKELEENGVPVFALTSKGNRGSLYRVSRFTISDFAMHPISAERFVNRVARLARQGRAVWA